MNVREGDDGKKTVRVVDNETGETVETLRLSDRGLDGLYQRIDWDRFHTEEEETPTGVTELTMRAEESTALHLHVEWLSGRAGDAEFTLESGAGCGSALLVMGVKRGDSYVREAVDIRTIVEPWVDSILSRMGAKENEG